MSETMVVHESVYKLAGKLAEERGITKKEAIRDIVKEAGYDV